MIFDLDHPASLDRGRAGAKAAALAGARQTGLPVVPGFVVESFASLRHMEIGAIALSSRGSGGARLAVTSQPAPDAELITAAAAELSNSLVVRSSSPLEGGGEWAGAFTSYVDIDPAELPKAVVGCWASAFSLDALERQAAAGLDPGSVGMAVLVQPAIEPAVAGVAEVEDDGSIVVHAVAGSPVPLLQGWEKGVIARRGWGQGWSGGEAIALVGDEVLEEIRSVLETARSTLGVNRCEWGLSDRLWLLQVSTVKRPDPMPSRRHSSTPVELVPTVRALMAAPGILGRELVLPWALAGLPDPLPQATIGDGDLLARAVSLSGSLSAQVWGRPAEEAAYVAREILDRLRGTDPTVEVARIAALSPPDPGDAAELLGIIPQLGAQLADRGVLRDARSVWHLSVAELKTSLEGGQPPDRRRVGVGPWEPLAAAVVLDHGHVLEGIPAAAGAGAGVRHHVTRTGEERPSHRAMVTAGHALPSLSQLVWDAAGLVTHAGSPAAHVFETARSLGVPAVCGVDLGEDEDLIVAVDGHTGMVSTLPLVSER